MSLGKEMTTPEHFIVPENEDMLKVEWDVSKEHWPKVKGLSMAKATI